MTENLKTTFASYKINQKIGEGGAGSVYSVLRDDDKEFALKILDPSKATTDKRRRFKNEIAFSISGSHKNIVHIVDHGIELKTDSPFLRNAPLPLNLKEGNARSSRSRSGNTVFFATS